MVSTFVDTGYLVAIAHERDQWHAAALAARKRLGSTPLVTTDEVLVEFLAAFSSAGRILRRQAAKTVRDILTLRSVTVAPQSRESFLGGLERYESREDKEYSLVDCVSMNVMQEKGITRALTNDHHFEQEGFTVLMSRSDELPTSFQNSG